MSITRQSSFQIRRPRSSHRLGGGSLCSCVGGVAFKGAKIRPRGVCPTARQGSGPDLSRSPAPVSGLLLRRPTSRPPPTPSTAPWGPGSGAASAPPLGYQAPQLPPGSPLARGRADSRPPWTLLGAGVCVSWAMLLRGSLPRSLLRRVGGSPSRARVSASPVPTPRRSGAAHFTEPGSHAS